MPIRSYCFLITVLTLGFGPSVLVAAPTQTSRSLLHTYEFPKPVVENCEGKTQITIPGLENLQRGDEPALPVRTARILLPPGAKVARVTAESPQPPEALAGSWRMVRGSHLSPPQLRSEERPAIPGNWQTPERREVRPKSPMETARLISVQRMLGHDIAIINLFPVSYRPTDGQLLYARQLKITVDLTPAGPKPMAPTLRRGQAEARSRVAAWVDNPELVTEYRDFQASSEPASPPIHDYLLVTRSSLAPAFQPLVEQKTRAGLSVKVETLEAIEAAQPGRDLPEKLRNFIRYACTNWGVQFVLLGGDAGMIPCRHAFVYANESEANCYLPTDAYFACLDGTWNRDGDKRWGEPTDGDEGGEIDLLAEVWVGRAPVDTPEEAANFVEKTIRYEQQSNRHSRTLLLAAEFLGRFSPDIDAQGGDMFKPLLPLLGGCTLSWLDDRPHTTPQWDAAGAIEALNKTPHFVLYNGHGQAGAMMRLKPKDLTALTNEDPFLAYSVSCNAGRFDNDPFSPDSIAESLVSLPRHGAFAAIFNARVGWFDPRQVWKYSGEYQTRFFARLFETDSANLGKACQLSKHDLLDRVETSGVMAYRWCYFQINLLGDPHTPVRLSNTKS